MWTLTSHIAVLLLSGHLKPFCLGEKFQHDIRNYRLYNPDSVSIRLLYGESHGISWTDLQLNDRLPPLLTQMYMDVWSLDYHYRRKLLFFCGWGSVWRMSMTPTGTSGSREAVVEGVEATSVAVDWVRDRVYWLSLRAKRVERVDLAGGERTRVLEDVGNLTLHSNLVLDPYTRSLFLAADGGSVLRSDLDGCGRRDVVLQGHGDKRVVSLAIDIHAKRLFVSARKDFLPRILSCDYNGKNVQDYDLSDEWWRSFVSIGAMGRHLFWAHQGWEERDSVWKANITRSGALRVQKEYTSRTFLLDPDANIWSLRVYHPSLQMPGPGDDADAEVIDEDHLHHHQASKASSQTHSPQTLFLWIILCIVFKS